MSSKKPSKIADLLSISTFGIPGMIGGNARGRKETRESPIGIITSLASACVLVLGIGILTAPFTASLLGLSGLYALPIAAAIGTSAVVSPLALLFNWVASEISDEKIRKKDVLNTILLPTAAFALASAGITYQLTKPTVEPTENIKLNTSAKSAIPSSLPPQKSSTNSFNNVRNPGSKSKTVKPKVTYNFDMRTP